MRTQSLTTQLPHAADGVQGALSVAFQMEPDVIFLVSDADFQRNLPRQGDVPWDELERTLRDLTREYGIEPRLHFIGFQVESEAADAMEKITRRYKGQFRKL